MKKILLVTLACATASLTQVGGASPAKADNFSCPSSGTQPTIRSVQPVDGNVLKVARIAGADNVDPDEWEMNLDTWWCNPSSTTWTLKSAFVRHLDAANAQIRTRSLVPEQPDPKNGVIYPVVNPGSGGTFSMFRDKGENGQFPFPVASKIEVNYGFTAGSTSITVTRTFSAAEHMNPRGGYFPPFRQSDFTAEERSQGIYWTQGRHGESNYQRFAYDIGVNRWTGSGWTWLRPGKTAGPNSTPSENWLAWDRPIYAMSDGEIIGCNRDAPDNPRFGKDDAGNDIKTIGNVPGGNVIWIRSGNETTLYAHLKYRTIPFELCPFTGDAERRAGDPNADPPADNKYKITAGTYLGQSGASGTSIGGPHIHIHTFLGLPKVWSGTSDTEGGIGADGRPLKFTNVRVQPFVGNQAADPAKWNRLDPSAHLPYDTLIDADPCGQVADAVDTVQEVRVEFDSACFGDVYNLMTHRGYRPTHVDIAEKGAASLWTMIWRVGDGTGWHFLHGMSADQVKNYTPPAGYRIVALESYVVNNALRFAVITSSTPGPSTTKFVAETASQWGSTLNAQTGAGRYPVAITVAQVGGVAYLTTLYQEANVGAWWIHAGLTTAQFSQAFTDNTNAGRSLAFTESHVENGDVRWVAIYYQRLVGGWTVSPVVSKAQVLTDIQTNGDAGRYTKAISGFHLSGSEGYRGLYRTAPDSTITGGPGPSGSTATFTFTSSDPFATQQCRVDSGAWQVCKDSITVNAPSGTHTFAVRSIARDGIVEDDPATATFNGPAPEQPTVSVVDLKKLEGDGSTPVNFPVVVKLSKTSSQPVKVKFTLTDGTAKLGSDYNPPKANGTVVTEITIPAGSLQKAINVKVIRDNVKEADETFFVKLTSATGATIADGDATVTIRNDD